MSTKQRTETTQLSSESVTEAVVAAIAAGLFWYFGLFQLLPI